jgi:hypothetical protein
MQKRESRPSACDLAEPRYVTYAPKWERPSDAVDRVMKSTAVSREQAETDICRVISDRAIDVRAKLCKTRDQVADLAFGSREKQSSHPDATQTSRFRLAGVAAD